MTLTFFCFLWSLRPFLEIVRNEIISLDPAILFGLLLVVGAYSLLSAFYLFFLGSSIRIASYERPNNASQFLVLLEVLPSIWFLATGEATAGFLIVSVISFGFAVYGLRNAKRMWREWNDFNSVLINNLQTCLVIFTVGILVVVEVFQVAMLTTDVHLGLQEILRFTGWYGVIYTIFTAVCVCLGIYQKKYLGNKAEIGDFAEVKQ